MHARPKILVPLCLILALAAPWPAMAQPSGGGPDGPTSSPATPEPPPDAGPSPVAPPPPPPSPSPSPNETALEAVQNKRALPLADIVARNGIVDQLINAQLVMVSGQLVYRLKLLSVSGQLRVLYFLADTGTALEGD